MIQSDSVGIVKVGGGRGFVVQSKDWRERRLIITAAHCLPRLPPCHAASDLGDRTYSALIGPVGGAATVWAECLFADPVADIAVLGAPDDQELPGESEAFDALIDGVSPLSVSDALLEGPAWLYSLDGRRFPCRVERQEQGPLWIFDAAEEIVGGMSGSPITVEDSAIGLISVSSATDTEPHTQGGPNPALSRNLPAWLHRTLRWRRARYYRGSLISGHTKLAL
jgi:hypothetical protein